MVRAKGCYARAGLDAEIRPVARISLVEERQSGRTDVDVGNTALLTSSALAYPDWRSPASFNTPRPSSWHAVPAAFSPLMPCVANGS